MKKKIKVRKLFAKYRGKWYEVSHLYTRNNLEKEKITIIRSKYANGKPLCKKTLILDNIDKLKFKNIEVNKDEKED